MDRKAGGGRGGVPIVGPGTDVPTRRLTVLVGASRILGGSLDLGMLDRLARLLVPTVADLCVIELIEPDGTPRRVATAHGNPSREGLIDVLGRSLRDHRTIASALRRGSSFLARDLDERLILSHIRRHDDRELMRRLGFRSGMAVPMLGRERTVGVIMLGQAGSGRRFDDEDLALVEDIARQAALAAENAMLFQDLKVAERALHESNMRAAFLAEVSRALVSSLDPESILRRVVFTAVRAVADWCAIDLARPDGTIDRIAVAHRDESRIRVTVELGRGLDGGKLDPAARRGASRVILTGRSEIEPQIMDDWLVDGVRGDRAAPQTMRRSRVGSYMCVPLIARGRRMGALTLVTEAGGRRYKTADLWLAEDMAHRVALALDNARLYAESAHVAHTLQQSLIPPDMPPIPGVDLAARFRPAGQGVEVGGDFYDLFSTGRRDYALVMGDVCGKGADAAAVTALARYTIRAAAVETKRPRLILDRLNEALLRQRGDDRFCTVAYVRARAAGHLFRLTASSAGHPVPMILRAEGSVEEVGGPGMLLGAFDEVLLSERSTSLGPGDALVLYTDGVTEAGRGSAMLGDEGLATVLASCRGLDANGIAARVEEAALSRAGADLRDDIAIVVWKMHDISSRLLG